MGSNARPIVFAVVVHLKTHRMLDSSSSEGPLDLANETRVWGLQQKLAGHIGTRHRKQLVRRERDR
jgi:hypothetical protein